MAGVGPLVGLIPSGVDIAQFARCHMPQVTRGSAKGPKTPSLLNPVASGYPRTRSVRAPEGIKCAFQAAWPEPRRRGALALSLEGDRPDFKVTALEREEKQWGKANRFQLRWWVW